MAGTDLTRIEGKSPEETPAPERVDPGTAPASPASLLLRLQSLQEMQAALQVEDLPDEILRVGVAASVEILGADCGIALLEELGSSPEIRCGWGEGPRLPRHHIEILSPSLQRGPGAAGQGGPPPPTGGGWRWRAPPGTWGSEAAAPWPSRRWPPPPRRRSISTVRSRRR